MCNIYIHIHMCKPFLFFCHTNAKPVPKHWTKIVIENIANSRFRSSSVGSRVRPQSRLVSVLNDTHWLAWITQQMLHVSLCEYSISLRNLSTFLLSLILSHDRDHASKYFHICRLRQICRFKDFEARFFPFKYSSVLSTKVLELVTEARGNRDFGKKTSGS